LVGGDRDSGSAVRRAGNRGLVAKLAAGVEGRVDVDEGHFARKRRRQSREGETTVAEDEAVIPPVGGVAPVSLVGLDGRGRRSTKAGPALPFPDKLGHLGAYIASAG